MLVQQVTSKEEIPEFRFAPSGMTNVSRNAVIPANAGIYIFNSINLIGNHKR